MASGILWATAVIEQCKLKSGTPQKHILEAGARLCTIIGGRFVCQITPPHPAGCAMHLGVMSLSCILISSREQSESAQDSDNLREALRYSASMLAELRTSYLTPQKYFELYMQVFDKLTFLEVSERDVLQSSHNSLWGHSSHDRLIGRGVPGVASVSH